MHDMVSCRDIDGPSLSTERIFLLRLEHLVTETRTQNWGWKKHTESSNQCNQHLVQAAPLPDFPVNTRPVATQHPPQWCRRCMSEASTFYPKTPRPVATGCSAAGLWWPWYRTPHWVLKTGPAHAANQCSASAQRVDFWQEFIRALYVMMSACNRTPDLENKWGCCTVKLWWSAVFLNLNITPNN